MMHKKMSCNYNGFTLIELLVVIAIISLLVSILLPSLQQVKELAKSTACKSLLRNGALAFAMYADDYGDCYPPYATINSNGYYHVWSGYYLETLEYLPRKTLYGGNDTLGYGGGCPAAVQPCMWPYAMNWYTGLNGCVKRSDIQQPAETFNVCEAKDYFFVHPGSNPEILESMWRHFDSSNFLFCDGHVGDREHFVMGSEAASFWWNIK